MPMVFVSDFNLATTTLVTVARASRIGQKAANIPPGPASTAVSARATRLLETPRAVAWSGHANVCNKCTVAFENIPKLVLIFGAVV